MANTYVEERSTSALIANVIADVQTLLRDELRLAKTEVSAEFAQGKKNLALNGMAIILATYSLGFLGGCLTFVLVELGLPWWASFGVLAILFGAGAAGVFGYVRRQAKAHLVPQETVQNVKETVQSVRENVQWIRKQN